MQHLRMTRLVFVILLGLIPSIIAQEPNNGDYDTAIWCDIVFGRQFWTVYMPRPAALTMTIQTQSRSKLSVFARDAQMRCRRIQKLRADCLRTACSEFEYMRAWSSMRSTCRINHNFTWNEEDQPPFVLEEQKVTVTVIANSTATADSTSSTTASTNTASS